MSSLSNRAASPSSRSPPFWWSTPRTYLTHVGADAIQLNQNETACRYDRAHPRRVCFPWDPLISLPAEGRRYPFDYGVYDRNLGGVRVTPEHRARRLPSSRPLIANAVAHHDYILRTCFPDHVLRRTDPELPGWHIYGPPRAPSSRESARE